MTCVTQLTHRPENRNLGKQALMGPFAFRAGARQEVVQSQTTQISEEHIATSFSQVTDTYSSISSYFVETSRTLVSQTTTIQEAGSTLIEFQQRITQAVEAISGGCDCSLDGVNTETIQTTIVTWFVQLQYMVSYCQQRFPTQYQSYFGSTFQHISTRMQVALGVAYAAGVNVDTIVSHAVQKAHVNPKLLASVNIQTHQFTQISKAVTSQTGVFAKNPAPVGPRFPERLKKVISEGKHRGLPPPPSSANATRTGKPSAPDQANPTRGGKPGAPGMPGSHDTRPGVPADAPGVPGSHDTRPGVPAGAPSIPGSHDTRPGVPALEEPQTRSGGSTAGAPGIPPQILSGAPGSFATHMPNPAGQPSPRHPHWQSS
ncbi:hypothetical protein VP01_53g2 [Puccinia sorghi]|uniref:Uncharacterized protein n=1 Tax=Puccinia sorghi TaxID=27349 RepID=A0A0L6UJU1_9BASI|nr:hypothetical protein VP01_53g2 [Puccinia sorghi]